MVYREIFTAYMSSFTSPESSFRSSESSFKSLESSKKPSERNQIKGYFLSIQWIPVIRSRQNICNRILFSFISGQLMGPRNPSAHSGTLSCIAVFCIISGLLLIGKSYILPRIPSFGSDMATQFTINVNNLGIRPPRSAQKDFLYGCVSNNLAIKKHKAKGLPGRGGSRGDIGILKAAYGTIGKHRCCLTEYEIGGPLYVTILI